MRQCKVFMLYKIICGLFLGLIAADALSFGVIMTTPQERAVLDRGRNGLDIPSIRLSLSESTPAQVKVLALDGLVKREGGTNTIWINGVLTQKPSVAGVSIDANRVVDNSVVLKLPTGASPILLKPGQRYGIDSGAVGESYKRIDRGNRASQDSVTSNAEALPDVLPAVE